MYYQLRLNIKKTHNAQHNYLFAICVFFVLSKR